MELALRRSFGIPFSLPLNRGIRGLGDCGDGSDPAYDAWCASGVDPNLAPVDTGGSVYSQLIAAGVNPVDAAAYATSPAQVGGSTGPISSPPAASATPAESAAAQAWLLQNVPATPAGSTTAQVLSALALTAAQIASGVAAGSVQAVPVATCASGYRYSSGTCVPGAAASTPLIAGVSNTTLAIAAFAFVALMMMGKKR